MVMMRKCIRILMVDDHEVVRDGLRHMLELESDIEVVGEAADAREALTQVELLSPEIVLMDIKMPKVDGIELTQRILQRWPACKVIMLTLYDEYLAQAMEAGAAGYLLKDIKREELARAIRRINKGEVVISDGIAAKSNYNHAERQGEKTEVYAAEDGDSSSTVLREVQLIIHPPFDAVTLARFISRVEDMLNSSMQQMVGSWDGGTVVTIPLSKPDTLVNIMSHLEGMFEVEKAGEKPLVAGANLKLIRESEALPRTKAGHSRIIFVTLNNY